MNKEYILDSFQSEAVKSKFRNTLVISAPGSGKTTVIINRLIYLNRIMKVKSKSILVITFTKAAAENMKDRYIKANKEGVIPFMGTFHSFYYSILKKYYNIEIIEEAIAYRVVKSVLDKYLDEISYETVKEALNNISLFKCRSRTSGDFTPSFDEIVFKEVYTTYESYKKENNFMDFDDLQLVFLKLLMEDKEILNYYRKEIKYILVDEFQDCDILQIEILRLLNYDNSIFAVGDEDQCIYSFRYGLLQTV
ncbi:MAG TPA: UvrD-helicase domain-containing protein [Clostridiaceae bacterium]